MPLKVNWVKKDLCASGLFHSSKFKEIATWHQNKPHPVLWMFLFHLKKKKWPKAETWLSKPRNYKLHLRILCQILDSTNYVPTQYSRNIHVINSNRNRTVYLVVGLSKWLWFLTFFGSCLRFCMLCLLLQPKCTITLQNT